MTLADALSRAALLPAEKQAEISDFVEFLLNKYNIAAPTDEHTDLDSTQAFFGIWSDRDDMKDSAAYIRKLRDKEWEQRESEQRHATD